MFCSNLVKLCLVFLVRHFGVLLTAFQYTYIWTGKSVDLSSLNLPSHLTLDWTDHSTSWNACIYIFFLSILHETFLYSTDLEIVDPDRIYMDVKEQLHSAVKRVRFRINSLSENGKSSTLRTIS